MKKATTHSMNCFFLAKPKPRLIEIKGLHACRMLEVYAEPKDYLEDVAMAHWEVASTITACGNNSQHKLVFLAKPKPRLIGTWLRACRMLEVYAEPKDCLEDVGMAHWKRPHLLLRMATIHSTS